MRSEAWLKALRVTLRRFARRGLLVAGFVAGATLVVVLALLVYLRTASGRRLLAAKVNAWVSAELVSELRIERIDVLASDRLVISAATLFDAKGRAVLRVRGLSAPLDALTLLKSVMFGPVARVDLPNVHAERLEVGIFREPGGVSLVHAFDTRPSKGTSPSSSEAAKGPRIHLPQITIDCVSAHTDLSGLSQATAEVHASKVDFDWSPELFALGLASDDARVLQALPLAVTGRLHGQLRLPGAIDATLEGNVEALPFQASFHALNDELAFRLTSASLTPEAMRALVPSWPLQVPSRVEAELSGPLPAMRARVEARAGGSRLDGAGMIALTPSVKGELSLTGRELDARILAKDVPQTALNVDAKLELSLEPAPHLELNARLAKGDLFGAPLPEAVIHAAYAGDQITGTVDSGEPTLPVSGDFSVSPQGALGFHVRAQNLDLAALAPYGLHAAGNADLDVSGELAQQQLVAQFEARIGALRLAPVHAQSTLVRGKVHGSTTRLEQLGVELEAQGTKLTLGSAEFPIWALESKGPLERQLVSVRAGPESEPTLQGSTTLALLQGVTLSETRLDAELNGVKHQLELKSARLAAQLIELRELRWQVGAGLLTGSALIGAGRKQAELEASGLEVQAILRTLGMDASAWRGHLDASFQFEESGGARQGQLKGSLVDGGVPGIGALHADFAARVVDAEIEGQGALVLAELGQGKLFSHGTLRKGPLSWQSLANVLGELRLDVSALDLAEVGRRWLPNTSVAVSGFADGSVRLTKLDERSPATVSYEFRTRELGLRSHRTDEDVLRHAELSSHGEIGATETSLQLELKDAAGTWLSAQADQGVGWSDLAAVLHSSSSARLMDAPLRAALSARPRSLELLGVAIPQAFRGEVAANVNVTGTARRPEIEGALGATGLGTEASPSGKLGLSFGYSAEREEYTFAAHYAERNLAKLELSGGGHWGWFERGFGRDWSVHAEGGIERIELAPIGDLLGVRGSGEAAGHAAIKASASDLEVSGELNLGRLVLERHPLGTGKIRLRIHRALAEAQLSIAGADSSLEASAELGLCWDGGPCIDAQRGGSLDAKVKNYDLATFAPLLRSVTSEIHGYLNGFVSLAWDPADATGKQKTRLRADAGITRGSVTLIGGTGSMQCAELWASGKGEGTMNLTFKGCARSNLPNLRAKADVLFNGPVPQSVDAQFLEATRVPVSYEGVVLGTASVEPKAPPIQLKVDLTGARRTVDVSIPALDFTLPREDDTRLVDLAEDPAIHVTDSISPPEETGDADRSSPWSVSVKLGHAVSVRQPGMRVPVTGTLTQSPDGLLDGSIVLPEGGVVPQLGQIFRLKGGSVRFAHQAVKDGVLNIEATTRTADGVVVELYVSGTVEKPHIRLRSDPPRSENDIIALLLGVQASDTTTSSGQQSSDLRGSATALAMNQLLRGSALAGLQFGAGQTHKGDSVSTVSVRASNTVWLEGRTVRSSTQRTANSAVQSSGVIDWRFARGFSLRTQLGNISGLELRWSHRY